MEMQRAEISEACTRNLLGPLLLTVVAQIFTQAESLPWAELLT